MTCIERFWGIIIELVPVRRRTELLSYINYDILSEKAVVIYLI